MPELKRLLEVCERALHYMNQRGWNDKDGHELHEVYTEMKAAVEKARGVTSLPIEDQECP